MSFFSVPSELKLYAELWRHLVDDCRRRLLKTCSLHAVKLALSLVCLGFGNIWGVLGLNQPFLLGSVQKPSLFLFLTLCKSTTVVANVSFMIGSSSESGRRHSPGVTSSLLTQLIFFSLLHLVTLSLLPTNCPQHPPEQSRTLLITFLYSL